MMPKNAAGASAEEKPAPDVFEKSMGSFGRWHLWIAFIIFLVKFPVGWHQLNIIIIGPPPKVSCISDTSLDKCDPACEERIVDPNPFTNTIQSQWDLACDKQYLANLAQTFTMLGILVGNAIFGFWSDRQGRRIPMVVAVGIQAVSGTALPFVPWLWAFLVLRFIVATATGGTMCTSFVLLMELTGKKWRVTVATLYQVPTWLGHLTLAGIGYWLRDWHHSQLFISVPSFLLLSYYWLLPESPRWLVAAGRVDEATRVLEKAAKCNRRPTEEIARDVQAYADSRMIAAKGRCADLFNTKTMCIRTFVLIVNWIVVGFCFYGVAQYAGQMGGNIFVNIALSASIEVPGTCIAIFFLEYIGRKWTLIGSSIVSSIPMFVIPCLDVAPDSLWSPMMAVIAMFGLSIFFATIYIYTGELYPTFIRSIGVGVASMTARFGSITAPFVSTLVVYDFGVWLTPVIFGIAPLISAALSLLLPETNNTILPDSMEEANNLGKKAPKEPSATEAQK